MTLQKLNSYQKMKQKYEKRIQELTSDIIALVDEKDFTKKYLVQIKWTTKLQIEKTIWQGDKTDEL